MKTFETYMLSFGNSVHSSHSIKDEINVAPSYQRNGDVWNLQKKQLLIDSLINRYDIPKLYFHKLKNDRKGFDYAIIDGRQRLEAIWQYIDGDFPLSDEIDYIKDPSIDLRGMTYNDLAKDYPKIQNQLNGTLLPIVVVDTDDLDLIEDMFSRLNEAVPLNAAEKRNAIRGFCISAVTKLSKHDFFIEKVKYLNNRYQHRDTSIKLLYIEHCLENDGRLIDVKKVYLDGFAKTYKKENKRHIDDLYRLSKEVLDQLNKIFTSKDRLLASQASVPLYYLVARDQIRKYGKILFTRSKLFEFQEARNKNRKVAEKDIEKAKFDFLEFDRLSVQGTNDANSLKERKRIMLEFLN